MSSARYDVAIVGTGFGGLYALYRCRQLGLSARIWEAGAGVGGTWYWNRYPGARCDIESIQYSYQFDEDLQQDWNWSERYATQPEILRYAEHVAERFALIDGIDFERRVETARFDEGTSSWTLKAVTGEQIEAQFVIMATGCLSAPNWPPIKGYDQFSGGIYHTGLWPHEGVSLAGRTVAVIGTGSSGIQSIPRIAEEAKHVTVFQRTPNYTIPAHNAPLDPDYVAAIKRDYPAFRARARNTMNGINLRPPKGPGADVSESERRIEFERRWQEGGLPFSAAYDDLMIDEGANASMAEFVRDRIREIVRDPVTAEMLCPQNIIGAKRLCVDTDYYATYNRDNVDLIDIRTGPIEMIDKEGVLAGGRHYNVDAIVIATGFDAMTGALTKIDIQGVHGRSLKAEWDHTPSCYIGHAISGYPNLFTVTGPGSPSVLTNMLPTIEHSVEWVTDCIAWTIGLGASRIEADADAQAEWWQHVQEIGFDGLKANTDSWYLGANIEGKPRSFLPYKGGMLEYRKKCADVAANGYEGFTITPAT